LDKVRVAVIGCGTVARRHHVPALVKNPRAEIAALCDPAEAPARLIKERFGLRVRECRELDEVLSDPAVDVIDICTPSFTHYEYARRALDAGKHVLLEKPPVYTVEQAEDLSALADYKGVKLGVIFNQRYRDVVAQLKTASDEGLLGDIVKVQIIHHANLVFSESPWVWDETRSKYMLYEFGIHFLDVLVYLCGEHEEVVCVVPTYQESVKTTSDLQMIIRFKSGALCMVDLTQDSTRHSEIFTNIRVYGTATDAFVRFFPPLIRFTAGQESPQKPLLNELKSLCKFVYLLATRKFLAYRNLSHQKVLDMYVDWLVDNTPYPLTMSDALPTIRLLNDLESRIPGYAAPVGAAT
jgi:predicted dehydrogenase